MPKKKKNNNNKRQTQEQAIEAMLESITATTQLKSPTDFEIPHNFFAKISEFTNGGFMLFTFDQSGSPRCYQQFDTDTHNLAMTNFVSKYSSCMDHIQSNIVMNNLSQGFQNDEEDDDEDGSGINS
jgi:hypothetical protein